VAVGPLTGLLACLRTELEALAVKRTSGSISKLLFLLCSLS